MFSSLIFNGLLTVLQAIACTAFCSHPLNLAGFPRVKLHTSEHRSRRTALQSAAAATDRGHGTRCSTAQHLSHSFTPAALAPAERLWRPQPAAGPAADGLQLGCAIPANWVSKWRCYEQSHVSPVVPYYTWPLQHRNALKILRPVQAAIPPLGGVSSRPWCHVQPRRPAQQHILSGAPEEAALSQL